MVLTNAGWWTDTNCPPPAFCVLISMCFCWSRGVGGSRFRSTVSLNFWLSGDIVSAGRAWLLVGRTGPDYLGLAPFGWSGRLRGFPPLLSAVGRDLILNKLLHLDERLWPPWRFAGVDGKSSRAAAPQVLCSMAGRSLQCSTQGRWSTINFYYTLRFVCRIKCMHKYTVNKKTLFEPK